MVEIPDSLVERLKERQVILVAGLGCSELAGAPAGTTSPTPSPKNSSSRTRVRSWPD